MTEDPFLTHRGLLFTVAYEMLGSAADADDVLQESWLRWADVDQSQVREPRAYLIRVVTRQALNRLRTVSRRREDYVGEWLPEPLLTSPDVAEDVELAESVSIAMLTVLETLGPTERAVFVLREVFEMPYGEIAQAIGKSASTVRQIARRAREHVAARRPRVPVSRSEQQAVVERFLLALRTGQVQDLMAVWHPTWSSSPMVAGWCPRRALRSTGPSSWRGCWPGVDGWRRRCGSTARWRVGSRETAHGPRSASWSRPAGSRGSTRWPTRSSSPGSMSRRSSRGEAGLRRAGWASWIPAGTLLIGATRIRSVSTRVSAGVSTPALSVGILVHPRSFC